LVHVCRRWRGLILGSPTHLRVCLVCKHGTPVADMLTHSPPIPLFMSYNLPNSELPAEDEEGITLALRHRDRVRSIYLHMPVASLQKFIPAMDGEFPALEYLHISPPANHDAHLTLPPTFEAPNLRYFKLNHFTSPIGYPFFSTATGLVQLLLRWIYPSTYPHPNDFLWLLSLLPHLNAIWLSFCSDPNSDIERQMSQAPVTIHVISPSLHLFDFRGDSGFLEAILPHMAVPLLETFRVQFFNPLHFPVRHLANFIMRTENQVSPCQVHIPLGSSCPVLIYDRRGRVE
jgi:hypothetical protein